MTAADPQSRQVCWFEVHQFVAPLLAEIPSWPAAGTPAWCALDDYDDRKIAAVLDAGVRHSLRIDTDQMLRADASRDVADAADWTAIARNAERRSRIYIPRRSA